MAGPYQRLSNGQSADSGAQALTTVVNSVEAGLEDAEAAITAQAALIAGKAATAHTHPGVYDPAGSAASAQAAAIQRANHTGSQLASTISDFNTQVRTNRLDQLQAPTTAVGMGSQRITNVASPSASADAANKAYVDSASGSSGSVVNVLNEGIVADCRAFTVNTTSGDATVTATASSHAALGANVFSASDVGKAIHINAAGTAGAWLRTTVATYISATQVTLTVAPSATITGGSGLVGTDNTSAINTVCSALIDREVLYFPPSHYWYLTSGGHTISKSWGGLAGGGMRSSVITTSSSTATVFDFTGYGAEVRDLSLWHAAGAANYVAPGTAVWPTSGSALAFNKIMWSGGRVRRVATVGFYIGIDVDGGQVQIDDCILESSYYAGIRLDNSDPDYGMHILHGNHFAWSVGANQSGNYGVLWIKGGGLGITDCRFDGRQAYHVGMTFDGSTYTGNIRISDNMFEDFGTNAIRMTVSGGTGDLGYISIANNVIQGGGSSPIVLTAATNGSARSRPGSDHGIAAVSIIGNARYNGTGVMVDLTRCRDVAVVGNTQIGGTVLAQSNCLNVRES